MNVRFRTLPLVAASLALAVSAGCSPDDNFFGFRDAGQPDAGSEPPPPPVFPLKAGDELVFPGIGGRADGCGASEGGCDRALRATYVVKKVNLDDESNTWTINADYTYESTATAVEVAAIGQLFLVGVAPFADIDTGGAESGNADFRTRDAPTDGINANGFPFFHFEEAYANREDSAFRQASAEFIERVQELDPDANIENQAAEAKIEAYFKDELGVNPLLHKIRVDYHPFGFMCGWDERLAIWEEGMQRSDNAFTGTTTPLAAIFASPVELLRDDVRYRCSCSTRLCVQRDDSTTCLDPSDPDAAPLPCACLGSDPDPGTCG